MNVRGNRQKPIANRKTPSIVRLWEAGLTNENQESSPLPKSVSGGGVSANWLAESSR